MATGQGPEGGKVTERGRKAPVSDGLGQVVEKLPDWVVVILGPAKNLVFLIGYISCTPFRMTKLPFFNSLRGGLRLHHPSLGWADRLLARRPLPFPPPPWSASVTAPGRRPSATVRRWGTRPATPCGAASSLRRWTTGAGRKDLEKTLRGPHPGPSRVTVTGEKTLKNMGLNKMTPATRDQSHFLG